jgi:hypothetical protein
MAPLPDPPVIWVFPTGIPDGTLADDGQIRRHADIAGRVLGSPEKGQAYAQQRLSARCMEQLRPPKPAQPIAQFGGWRGLGGSNRRWRPRRAASLAH